MKLFHNPMSSNARKAVMTASILRSPVELVLVDLLKGEHRGDAYKAVNPNSRVPALVDGDLHLWESGAIMTYLADKSPGNSLYPTDPAKRADVNRWLFWVTGHWTPETAVLLFENVLKNLFGLGGPDEARVARQQDVVKGLAQLLDNHLANRKWMCGDEMTLADIAVACPLMATVPAKLPVSGFANLQRWFAQVQALDAWKQTEPR